MAALAPRTGCGAAADTMAGVAGELSGRRRRPHGIDLADTRLEAFWTRRLLCSLTTLRPDGTPHVVPVGATLDVPAGLVRVITSGDSRKARHVERAGADGSPIVLCQFDGRHWCSIEARAQVSTDPEAVADAEQRYARRYRTPRPNPSRVVLIGRITKILGTIPDLEVDPGPAAGDVEPGPAPRG